jgi:tyrosyl-tRNA synthetase
MKTQTDRLLTLFLNGLDTVIPETLADKLRSDKPLRVKFGADPSAPDLHLGHWALLKKLKYLQEMGHHIVFLVGDFTATIGDPTGKSETRKPLSVEQVATFSASYQDQVFRVLDRDKTEIVTNSTWLNSLSARDIITLTAKSTVARMLERDDFEKRFQSERPIGLHEFLYPLLQGYDSVVLKSDLEMGGTDQRFNILMGRHLQKEYGQPPQSVAFLPLLEGTDGVQKMSKSLGNAIGISEPPQEIFGKLMSIPDAVMIKYYSLLTDQTPSELATLQAKLDAGENPKTLKEALALNIVSQLYSQADADHARAEFSRVFSQGLLPEEMELLATPKTPFRLDDFLVQSGILPSKKEASRMAAQNAITVDGSPITDCLSPVSFAEGQVLKIGKRRYFKIQ